MTKPPVPKKRRSGNPNPQGNKGKGRPKGSVNKIPAAIKEAALGALHAGDGAQAFFEERKASSPDAFMGFLKGIVPLEVNVGGPDGGPLAVTVVLKKPNG